MVTAKYSFLLFSFKRKYTKTAVGIAAQGKSSVLGRKKTLLGRYVKQNSVLEPQ